MNVQLIMEEAVLEGFAYFQLNNSPSHRKLLKKLGKKIEQYSYVLLHIPNTKENLYRTWKEYFSEYSTQGCQSDISGSWVLIAMINSHLIDESFIEQVVVE